jgi:hypothetical protein
MTLRRRIARFEFRRGGPTTEAEVEAAKEEFLKRMARLEARLKASGDFSHEPKARRFADFVRACLRGDGSAAAEILDSAIAARAMTANSCRANGV